MTKAIDAKVKWDNGVYANSAPILQILFDELPNNDDFVYNYQESKDGKGFNVFAEKDGIVKFHHCIFDQSGPSNFRGYGGAEFIFHLKDGRVVKNRNAWSSRNGCFNENGYTPSIHVNYTSDPASFGRGFTFFAGDITVDLARQIQKEFLPDHKVVKVSICKELNWGILLPNQTIDDVPFWDHYEERFDVI